MSPLIPKFLFNLVSSFSHYGPTYMNPVHEAKDVDVSEVSKRLSVWHTLPVEASALLTLYPARGACQAR
ncbi:hypothetical protein IEQ34_023284 [Dendrobium chrysotoxum]|uniref:Uncharacterized protein n=1 Tax=Dendrobium chrysotoxum TaxID=161865 RepID=A0AAV7FV03_DENCH|nr:hypothetical protein IEQ34_023284 [Dendrobium chrysotoxum]